MDYYCEVPIPIIDTSIYLAVTRVTWHLKQLLLEEEKKKKKKSGKENCRKRETTVLRFGEFRDCGEIRLRIHFKSV